MRIFPLFKKRKKYDSSDIELEEFITKLNEIHDAIARLRSIDFSKRVNVVYYTNISKDCELLADMYETSNTFTPEHIGDEGFKSEEKFNNDRKFNTEEFQIPDYLRFCSKVIDKYVEGKDSPEYLDRIEICLNPFRKFYIGLMNDYNIGKFVTWK
jgi:hypothetical protein